MFRFVEFTGIIKVVQSDMIIEICLPALEYLPMCNIGHNHISLKHRISCLRVKCCALLWSLYHQCSM